MDEAWAEAEAAAKASFEGNSISLHGPEWPGFGGEESVYVAQSADDYRGRGATPVEALRTLTRKLLNSQQAPHP